MITKSQTIKFGGLGFVLLRYFCRSLDIWVVGIEKQQREATAVYHRISPIERDDKKKKREYSPRTNPGNCTPAIVYLGWKIKDFFLCMYCNVGDDKS